MRVPEPTYKDYYNLLNPAQGVFVPDNLRYPLDKRQKKEGSVVSIIPIGNYANCITLQWAKGTPLRVYNKGVGCTCNEPKGIRYGYNHQLG